MGSVNRSNKEHSFVTNTWRKSPTDIATNISIFNADYFSSEQHADTILFPHYILVSFVSQFHI